MDSNERKIVQELVTVLGCVIPASDGHEPRTNLWNKYMAAKNMLAAAPQVVSDKADLECQVPPFGWRCTRGAGHPGPCAAVECPEDVAAVELGMSRLAAAPVQVQEPVAGTAVEAVLLSDMVEGSHPQYGNGLFATENCVTTLYRAPVQPVAVPDGELPTDPIGCAGYLAGMAFGNCPADEIGHCVSIITTALAAPAAQGDAKDAGLPDGVVVSAFQAAHDKSWWISIKHPFGHTNKLATQGRDLELCRLLVAHSAAIAAKAAS